jgi:hypothetical protein
MGNLFSPKLTICDRIVEINGISLNNRCFCKGRHVICYSQQLEKYIIDNHFDKKNGIHLCIIENLLHDKKFNDIKIIKIIKK